MALLAWGLLGARGPGVVAAERELLSRVQCVGGPDLWVWFLFLTVVTHRATLSSLRGSWSLGETGLCSDSALTQNRAPAAFLLRLRTLTVIGRQSHLLCVLINPFKNAAVEVSV